MRKLRLRLSSMFMVTKLKVVMVRFKPEFGMLYKRYGIINILQGVIYLRVYIPSAALHIGDTKMNSEASIGVLGFHSCPLHFILLKSSQNNLLVRPCHSLGHDHSTAFQLFQNKSRSLYSVCHGPWLLLQPSLTVSCTT